MEKSLKQYAFLLDRYRLLVGSDIAGAEEKKVKNITYDSRQVADGCLFVCKGAEFKKEYLEYAVKHCCVGYVSETDYKIPGTHSIIVSDVREAMPHIARLFYEIPEDFKIIGITGTKGKTTTAYYVKSIFDAALNREHKNETAFISSIEIYDGKERSDAQITTPESFELYRHFKNACESGRNRIVTEVSSQALKYKRTAGIAFDAAVFLNISRDHISPIEHPDFDDYFRSKLKIFDNCGTAFICTDTDYYEIVRESAKKAKKIITFGLKEEADIYGFGITSKEGRTVFKTKYNNRIYDFVLNMRGRFNTENALAAIAIGFNYGLAYNDIYNGLSLAFVPGRAEEYLSDDGRINVIVDYAHNGLSFRNIIEMARQQWPDREIVTVFGSVGGKAFNRREDLSIVAGELSDKVYLTADDPAKEKVEDICALMAGFIRKTGCPYEIIPDRRQAVFSAINSRKAPSVVLILGKGAEKTQKVANKAEIYESDAVIAKEALKQYNNK